MSSGEASGGWAILTRVTTPSSLENHRLVAVHQHAVLDMPAHRAGEHHALDIATDGGEIVGAQRMIDALDVLLDDRPLVELSGDVVRRRADQLDAAVMRLRVGLRTLEARQKTVVDVDRAPLQERAERG